VENTNLLGLDDALHVPPSRLPVIAADAVSVLSDQIMPPKLSPSFGVAAFFFIMNTGPSVALFGEPWMAIVTMLLVTLDVPTNNLPELSMAARWELAVVSKKTNDPPTALPTV
jgi:hypothetical protein